MRFDLFLIDALLPNIYHIRFRPTNWHLSPYDDPSGRDLLYNFLDLPAAASSYFTNFFVIRVISILVT